MNRRGFSLIEMMIYASLLCIISVVSFSWMAGILKESLRIQSKSSQLMMAHSILQRFSQDVHAANPEVSAWQTGTERIQFHRNGNSIIWAVENNKLFRIENGARSLVAYPVMHLSMQLSQKESYIDHLDFKLRFKDMDLTHRIKVQHA